MTPGIETGLRVHVLNPGGRDPEKSFASGPGNPLDPGHPPVNHHAYAACTYGTFFREASRVSPGAVIILLRPRHLGIAARALGRLQARGHRVGVAVKEAGAAQFAEAFSDASRWESFCEITARADFFIAPTREMEIIFRGTGASSGGFLPTPYPVEFPEWDFSCPLADRRGVFVGTREFGKPPRQHLTVLAALAGLRIPATVINIDGNPGRRLLRAISPDFHIVDGPLPYPQYLRLMAAHRVVFQLDGSRVPGQVAGDALLCRMPCLGGDGTIDSIAFGRILPPPHDIEGIIDSLQRLLEDDSLWMETVNISQSSAASSLSFSVIATRLHEFIG